MTEHSKVKRGVGFLVTLFPVLIAAGCFQPIDVGSDRQPIANVNELDGGWLRGPDGSVACGPECNPEDGGRAACSGDLVIGTQQQWDDFLALGCSHFSGSIDVRADGPIPVVTNEVLQTVSGHLRIVSNPTSVSFPELTTVGGTVDLALSNNLTSVNLPLLTSAGSVNVLGNPLLTTLALPSLATVRGNLSIQSNGVTSVTLPSLHTIRGTGMGIVNNPNLVTISLPALQAPGLRFAVTDNPALTSLNLPALAVAESLAVGRNDVLVTVEAPLLATVIGSLTIAENATLSMLFLPSLVTVGQDFYVDSNPRLPQCAVDALEAQLTTAPVTRTVSNNAATCP